MCEASEKELFPQANSSWSEELQSLQAVTPCGHRQRCQEQAKLYPGLQDSWSSSKSLWGTRWPLLQSKERSLKESVESAESALGCGAVFVSLDH